MPHSDFLKRAFEIVRREPALWVMGFLLALFGGGGGSSSNFNWNTGGSGGGNGPGEGPFPENTPLPDLPSWATPENFVLIALAFIALLLVLGLVGLVVQSVALTGLIHGAERATRGIDVRWQELLRAGWSNKGRRIFGMKLLLALPSLLFVLLLFTVLLLLGLPLLSSAMAGDLSEPDPATMIGSILGIVVAVVCLSLLVALASWILSLMGNYAARSIVLEDQPTMAALGKGWQLLRGHIADTVVFSLILGVIGSVVGFLLGLLVLFLGLVIALPLFFLLLSMEFPLLLTVVIAFVVILFFAIVGSLLTGPLLAYYETAWTLVWQHFAAPARESAMPLTPEPTMI